MDSMTSPAHIRNLCVLAHVDAGKTTLTEQMLLASGAIRQAGSVDSGTTLTDFLPIERERGISVRSAQTSFVFENTLINLIDTPGHADFAGETERALLAADGAVLLLSAVEGLQPQTEMLFHALEALRIPTLLFINKIDRAGSHAPAVAEALPGLLCPGADVRFLPMQEISGEGSRGCAVSVPPSVRETLTEAAADCDDALALRYLSGEELSDAEILAVLAQETAGRRLFPVFFGAAAYGVGVRELLAAIPALLPPASARVTEEETLSAQIFRIEHDKTMGRVAHVRMYGGTLHARDAVWVHPAADADLPEEERRTQKITQIRKCSGGRSSDVGSVHAGDIAALCGLADAKVWDVIGRVPPQADFHLANPFLRVQALPRTPEELLPLAAALQELAAEDPLLDCQWEKTERQILVSITGKIQLEVLHALLLERYGLDAGFSAPTVIYRETPAQAGDGFDAYTMPKPCWAVVSFHFEPLPRGSGVVYDGGNIPHNTCFYKYQTHIRKSFFDSLAQGLYGWEVTDFRAVLTYAEHHTIHTHPLDFFVATPMAVMDTLRNTGTTLLEPMLLLRITAPERCLGKILYEITRMRGTFDAPAASGDRMTLEARVPAAESMDFPTLLASLSGGQALLSSRFDGYAPCPLELGAVSPRRGVNPLDRSKWILQARGAIQQGI